MNKFCLIMLFTKRALRSTTLWAIIITLTFCLTNYLLHRKMINDKLYLETAERKITKITYGEKENYDDYENNNKVDLKEALTQYEILETEKEENYDTDEAPEKVKNDGPGEMGEPFHIPNELLEEKEKRFSEFQFNIIASEMISLNRSLPDYRSEECRKKIYENDLAKTSIIIVFRNEAWSTLLRTIWSIINRTPKNLLEEIILVDDASELDELGDQLDDYIGKLSVSVKVFRTKNRVGLIKGRLIGVEHSKGPVILFLDSHCECTDGWLEPLLSRIKTNPKAVVAPQIDIIDDETFGFISVDPQVGGFDWLLDFKWMSIPEHELIRIGHDLTEPIRTPMIAGGLVAIDKQYFYDIGAYDDEMSIWGAENLEISLRIWQCGGVLELIHCSHVGHVFRKVTPHTFPDGDRKTIFTNKARAAEVWMDEWKNIFFVLNSDVQAGDVSKRKELRNQLKCKNFEWYLRNIYPESNIPLQFDNLGLIQNFDTKKCIEKDGRYSTNILLSDCELNYSQNVVFIYEKNKRIQADEMCLICSKKNETEVFLDFCNNCSDEDELTQNWFYDEENKNIINLKTGRCLIQTENNNLQPILILSECNVNSTLQKWELIQLTR